MSLFRWGCQRKQPAANGTKAPCPGFIEPELSTSLDNVPSGARWIREIQFNGYPAQVHLRDAAVKVFTPANIKESTAARALIGSEFKNSKWSIIIAFPVFSN